MWLMQNAMKNPDNAGAGAHHYMHILGIVATGLMWLRMAKAATGLLDAGEGDAGFLEAKLVTARFYADHLLSRSGSQRDSIVAGHAAVTEISPDAF